MTAPVFSRPGQSGSVLHVWYVEWAGGPLALAFPDGALDLERWTLELTPETRPLLVESFNYTSEYTISWIVGTQSIQSATQLPADVYAAVVSQLPIGAPALAPTLPAGMVFYTPKVTWDGSTLTWSGLNTPELDVQLYDGAGGYVVLESTDPEYGPIPRSGSLKVSELGSAWTPKTGYRAQRTDSSDLDAGTFGLWEPGWYNVLGIFAVTPVAKPAITPKLRKVGFSAKAAEAVQAAVSGDQTDWEVVLRRGDLSPRQVKTLRADGTLTMKRLLRGGFTRAQAKLILGGLA